MREFWEEIVRDPVALDLLKVLQAGFYAFETSKLTCLPALFGADNHPASASELREQMLPMLMADDPGKGRAAKNLSQNTKINLALFRVDGDSSPKGRQGAQQIAGKLHKPQAPISASAVAKRPSKKQPKGGIEWKHLLVIRQLIIQDAQARGRPLPEGLVGDTPADQVLTSSSGDAGSSKSSTGPKTLEPFSYHTVSKVELAEDFFDRNSTARFIESFDFNPVTIYAGAGVAADQGAPLGDSLMHRLLENYLEHHPLIQGLEAKGKSDKKRTERAQKLRETMAGSIALAIRSAYTPAYIGSIVRQAAENPPGRKRRRDPDGPLTDQIREIIDEAQTTGGFLARSVGALAFALLKVKPTNTVRIITTNYDESLTEQKASIEKYFAEFFEGGGFGFELQYSGGTDLTDAKRVPVAHINGVGPDDGPRKLDAPIFGEAQFFSAGGAHDSEYQQWREQQMRKALSAGVCLFVGTSLTDPDVIRALAITKGQNRRFVVVLAPDRESVPGGGVQVPLANPDVGSDERAIARDVIAQRYLHLGVEPIFVDRPYQVPQLVTELALRTIAPTYKNYPERLQEWWQKVEQTFAYQGKVAGERNKAVQETWQQELLTLRGTMYELLGLQLGTGEKLRLEVWVRNPVAQQLFLWATSENLWLFGDSAHTCDVQNKKSHYKVQETFWKGHRGQGRLDPARGQFNYHLSIPLTLHHEPWYHLPVGVVSVLSSEAKGELFRAKRNVELLDTMEDELQGRLNDLLDPVKRRETN